MPWLERVPERHLDAADGHVAERGKPELHVWREPRRIECDTGLRHVREDIVEIEPDEVREHEAIVQLGPPADERRGVRLTPETRDE